MEEYRLNLCPNAHLDDLRQKAFFYRLLKYIFAAWPLAEIDRQMI